MSDRVCGRCRLFPCACACQCPRCQFGECACDELLSRFGELGAIESAIRRSADDHLADMREELISRAARYLVISLRQQQFAAGANYSSADQVFAESIGIALTASQH